MGSNVFSHPAVEVRLFSNENLLCYFAGNRVDSMMLSENQGMESTGRLFCLDQVTEPSLSSFFCHLHLQDQFETLFHQFDVGVYFQFFKSFHRVRINFTNAVTAAQARVKLHRSDFNGKEMRLYFAQVPIISLDSSKPTIRNI